MERAGHRRGTVECPGLDLHIGVVSHRCVCARLPVYLHRCVNVCALPSRQSRAGASLSHVCMCVYVLLLSPTGGAGHAPAVLAALFPRVHASCEGVGASRGVHCCWQPLGCSCPAQPGWGVPSWGRHCFSSGCGRGSWLSSACHCPGGDRPTGLCGTSGAENQGGESIPRPQLAPLSLFGTSLLCLKEVPRQSRSSLPLKGSLSEHHCGYPDSLHKETGCLCCWVEANIECCSNLLLAWPVQGREYRDCSHSVLGCCTPLARP